jgi:hypothetical protein
VFESFGKMSRIRGESKGGCDEKGKVAREVTGAERRHVNRNN